MSKLHDGVTRRDPAAGGASRATPALLGGPAPRPAPARRRRVRLALLGRAPRGRLLLPAHLVRRDGARLLVRADAVRAPVSGAGQLHRLSPGAARRAVARADLRG